MWTPIQLHIENLASHEASALLFQNGQVVVIQGENLDKQSGQESNGSGKSALIEGVAVALTGTSFRKVRAAELVRNGQPHLRVVLSLRNQRIRVGGGQDSRLPEEHRGHASVMEIERIIYAGSKASQVKVKLNGQAVSRLTSVAEADEFIYEQLGVGKEDLLNYFLVSKEKFCSFFDTSDAKKKQLINRFSGADRLDQLVPQLEKTLDDRQIEVRKLEGFENQHRTRVQVYAEQIEQAQQAQPEQQRAELLQRLEADMYEAENAYQQTKPLLTAAQQAQELAEADLQALQEPDTAQSYAELEQEQSEQQKHLKSLRDQIVELEGPGSKFAYEQGVLAERTRQAREQQKEAGQNLKGALELQATLEKEIRGAAECPACQHEFSLVDKQIDVAQSRSELQELTESLLPQLEAEIERVRAELLQIDKDREGNREYLASMQQDVTNEIKGYEQKFVLPLQQRTAQIQQQAREFSQKQRAMQQNLMRLQSATQTATLQVQNAKRRLGTAVDKLETEQNRVVEDLVGPLREKLEQAQQQLEVAELSHGEAKTARDKAAAWPVRMKQFKSYLANQLLDTLSGYTNLYLEKIGSDLQIELEGYRLLADKKTIKEELTAKLLRGGEDAGSFHKYSGGERGRVDFCQILAVQQLINLNSPTGGLNLLLADEILESVDSKGVHELARKLDSLDKTILMVTHAGAEVPFPNRILVEKKDGVSRLLAA